MLIDGLECDPCEDQRCSHCYAGGHAGLYRQTLTGGGKCQAWERGRCRHQRARLSVQRLQHRIELTTNAIRIQKYASSSSCLFADLSDVHAQIALRDRNGMSEGGPVMQSSGVEPRKCRRSDAVRGRAEYGETEDLRFRSTGFVFPTAPTHLSPRYTAHPSATAHCLRLFRAGRAR